MPGNNAKMEWTGDSKDARKAIDKLIRKINKLDAKAKQSSKKQKEGLGAVKQGAAKAGAALGGLAVAYSAISSQLSGLIQQQVKYNQLQQSSAVSFDQNQKRLLVQAGVKRGSKDGKFLRNKVFNLSNLLGTDVASTQAGATEFISAGGSVKQIKQGVFDEIARLGVGTNNTDLAGLSKQVAIQLSQQTGKEVNQLTAQEVRAFSVEITNLFKKKTFQTGDLGSLGAVSALGKEFKVPRKELLGAFSVIKNIEGEKSDKAAERMKIFMRELAVASVGKNKTKNDALKKLGLSPTSLKGKGFVEKFEILNKGIDEKKLSPEEATVVLSDLLGGEAGASGFSFARQTGKARSASTGLNNQQELIDRVKIGSTGASSVESRVNNRDLFQGSAVGITTNQKKRIIAQTLIQATREGLIDKRVARSVTQNFESFADANQGLLNNSPEATVRTFLNTQTALGGNNIVIADMIDRNIRDIQHSAFKSSQVESTEALMKKSTDIAEQQNQREKNKAGNKPRNDKVKP